LQIYFEQLCDKIRDVQNMPITPSPVHVVHRSQPLQARQWWERVIMRRLGLHGKEMYERVLIPNTPHYNRLLYAVKHMITMRPITFPDGVPTEKDVGAVRLEEHTGALRIDEKFRVPHHRVYGDKMPDVFSGKQMRSYLRRTIGIFGNNW
jgi:large subunit ribosomal protein L30